MENNEDDFVAVHNITQNMIGLLIFDAAMGNGLMEWEHFEKSYAQGIEQFCSMFGGNPEDFKLQKLTNNNNKNLN